MIEKLKKVYYCEHCSKKAFTKHTIAKHEPICFGNPENVPPCMNGCKHLENPKTTGSEKRSFYCSKFGKELHTKGAEVYQLLERYPEHYMDSQLMPQHCFAFETPNPSEVEPIHFLIP